MTVLGNDVVDLRDPRCAAKSFDDRFVGRVFADDEAERIRTAPDPDRQLWVHWAAKEAAFKAISKALGSPPPFEHAAFVFSPAVADDPPVPGEVEWAESWDREMAPTGCEPRRGRVRYREREVPIRLDVAPDRIHALAWLPGSGVAAELHRRVRLAPEVPRAFGSSEWKEPIGERLTEREWRSVHHPASAFARLHARSDFARITGMEERVLEIVCDPGPPGRMPPRIVCSGRDHPADLTLSHHGRFVAWAFALPPSAAMGDPASGGAP